MIKPGGLACLIGPVHPTFWLSRFFADVWMLFPTEDEYMEVCSPLAFLDSHTFAWPSSCHVSALQLLVATFPMKYRVWEPSCATESLHSPHLCLCLHQPHCHVRASG